MNNLFDTVRTKIASFLGMEKDAATRAMKDFMNGAPGSYNNLIADIKRRLARTGRSFEDWMASVSKGTKNIAKQRGTSEAVENMGKTRDKILDKIVDKAQKSSRGKELNLGQAVKELAQTDDIGNAVDARRIAKGRGRIRKSRFGSDIQEDLFNNDVLNAAAAAGGRADNYNNKLRSNFVATRGSGANAFTDQANGLGVLENTGANWDNYRTGQEVANGPRRSNSTGTNYRARPTGDYQAQGYASQDLNDYIVNRYNKYDLLPQFRKGDVFNQEATGYVPGFATDQGLNLYNHYKNNVNDSAHSWSHAYNDVTNLGINAGFGENMAPENSEQHNTIKELLDKVKAKTGVRGDKTALDYLKEHPEARAQFIAAGSLHDIGNYGMGKSKYLGNFDEAKLDNVARDLHNLTGAGMINGNMIDQNISDEDLKQLLKMQAPEAYQKYVTGKTYEGGSILPEKVSKNLDMIRAVLGEGKELTANPGNPNGLSLNRLENILNQSGYNANAHNQVDQMAQATLRHRGSANEMYHKAMDKEKYDNPEWAQRIKEYALPNDPMSYAVAGADKLGGDELSGADIPRAIVNALITKMEGRTPSTPGNLLNAYLDALRFKYDNSKELIGNQSYNDFYGTGLRHFGDKKQQFMKDLSSKSKSDAASRAVAREQARKYLESIMPGGSLSNYGYFEDQNDEALQNGYRQLRQLSQDPNMMNDFLNYLQLGIRPGEKGLEVVNPLDLNQLIDKNFSSVTNSFTSQNNPLFRGHWRS